jgi:hypothetical protein
LASGDIFADMYSTGTYSVQPAASVQVMITHVFSNDGNGTISPKGSGGTLSGGAKWNNSGGATDNRIGYNMSNTPMKLFITNSDYFQLAGSQPTAYTGIEI